MNFGIGEIIIIVVVAFIGLGMWRLNSSSSSGSGGRKYIYVDWDAIHDPGVRDLISQNQQIDAVKRYRELSGVGLKEANDAISYLMDHPNAVIEKVDPSSLSQGQGKISAADEVQIRDFLRQGNKIEAIKIYRKATGLGLREAKDAIDAMEQKLGSSIGG